MRIRRIFLLLLISLLLSACGAAVPAETTLPVTIPATELPAETTAPGTVPTTEPLPEHSDLYRPGLSADDLVLYFNEVCLDAEFVNSGDPSLLQKWESPIRYTVFGSPTEKDTAVLNGFVDWLNTIEGFPGIGEAASVHEQNLRIYFCDQEELLILMGDNFIGMDGAVTFWYDFDVIYDGIICIRTDLDQHLRNSVILEELYNCLGPIQDTSLREDSIIYAGYSEPQSLTEVDELILKFLYHPVLECGMNARECEILIRELYS